MAENTFHDLQRVFRVLMQHDRQRGRPRSSLRKWWFVMVSIFFLPHDASRATPFIFYIWPNFILAVKVQCGSSVLQRAGFGATMMNACAVFNVPCIDALSFCRERSSTRVEWMGFWSHYGRRIEEYPSCIHESVGAEKRDCGS